jgi:hypothetical protein
MRLFRPKPVWSLLLLLGLLPIGTGCTYTAAISQTNIPADHSHPVQVEVYKFIFFGTFDNDQVLTITSKLHARCPHGAVRGIMTKDLRTWYFFTILMAQDTYATGFCVKGSEIADSQELPQLSSAEGVTPSTSEQPVDLGDEL